MGNYSMIEEFFVEVIDIATFNLVCKEYLANNKRWLNYIKFWKQGGIDRKAESIAYELNDIVEILENSDQNLVLNKTMDFPIIKSYNLANFHISPKVGTAMAIFLPVGGLVYFVAVYRRKLLNQDIRTTTKVCDEIINIINELYK